MIYDKISKGDDGIYHVRAFSNDRKRNFYQLNNVLVTEASPDFTIALPEGCDVLKSIHEDNVQAAVENSEGWFGRALSGATLKSAYVQDTGSSTPSSLTCERLPNTKVFNASKEVVEFDTVKTGDKCDIVVEFSGLWFAKKAYGPDWNIIQVKLQPEPIPEPEPEPEPDPEPEPKSEFDETYPEDYMFSDTQ